MQQAKTKKSSPPGRTPRKIKGDLVRVSLEIPMLMRQAIRAREKMSNSNAADIVRGILLTALRVEMELLRREHSSIRSA